eukprot:CAMPEP_0194373956 /NCGR_PEP_ID=MMETSP0174-20130528/22325_1 /TAXON_ID=216777 /ORGANISM="Proboscia alata, Strain PI-D3" /LENGTH=925 /DNA_ID=CAMNT_0039153245 /DNA_START=461 /DNA_END=3238 /DNA_ORIENTATION=+
MNAEVDSKPVDVQQKEAFAPTEEQTKIYATILPPTKDPNNESYKPHIVRITAGAGAGKTTTILNLAAQAAKMGHSYITYVTFNKAAAMDGRNRIRKGVLMNQERIQIVARTMHSCAMTLLANQRNETSNQPDDERQRLMEAKLMSDQQTERYISKVCALEIKQFLQHSYEHISQSNTDLSKRKKKFDEAERQVVFFIGKTLRQFCIRSDTVQQFRGTANKSRNYFPATTYHEPSGNGEKFGLFPSNFYRHKVGEYANMAFRLWENVERECIRTYDFEMKRAQLSLLQIPGSILLVDECQDLDGCQTDWIVGQVKYGTHVYLVGDAAQTIYSFRGAKSKFMMGVEVAPEHCCSLTKSWRFGKAIASVANVVLYAKHKSSQTTDNKHSPIWSPYRLQGCNREGTVTDEALLPKWKEMPVTLIAATNATLLLAAVQLFGMDTSHVNDNDYTSGMDTSNVKRMTMKRMHMEHDAYEEDEEEGINSELYMVTPDDESMLTSSTFNLDACDEKFMSFPKIHINGKGENSGVNKWKLVMKQISYIYDLYNSGTAGLVLPREAFPEFRGETVTWDSFLIECENREITRFHASMYVVSTLEDKTMPAMEIFQREVLDKKYQADDANIVLTTCHAAKGMEWNNVQICEDFFNPKFDISSIDKIGPLIAQKAGQRQSWQFNIKKWGDDINLLYVACTRAKKLLSIPSRIISLLDDFDILHDMLRAKKLYKETDQSKVSNMSLFGRTDQLTVGDALNVYKDLVHPLREENQLETKDKLKRIMVSSIDNKYGDSDEDVKALDDDKDFEAYFRQEALVKTAELTIFDKMEAANTRIPKEKRYPFDLVEKRASTGRATCRSCNALIAAQTPRVGVQVYQANKDTFWLYWFHNKDACFPSANIKKLRLDPKFSRRLMTKDKRSRKGGYVYSKGFHKQGRYR